LSSKNIFENVLQIQKKGLYLCINKMINAMTTLELISAVNNQAKQTKNELTKSYFSGDKSFYNELLSKFPKMEVVNNVYETINNISAKYAQSLEY